MPEHTEASVYFDLYIIGTWNGNDSRIGPHIFDLSVVQGPTLLHTTFSNPWIPERLRWRVQSYPGEYPGNHNPPQTGAVEVNTLGFTLPVRGTKTVMDSIYKLSYTFSHRGSALLLDFSVPGLETLEHESWGLANVQVSVAAPASQPIIVRQPAPLPRRSVHITPHSSTRRIVAHRSATTPKRPVGPKASHPPVRLHAKERPPGL